MSVREELKNHIDHGRLTLKTVAAQLGYSQTVVSQFLSGNYPGDIGKVEQQVSDYLQRERERSSMGLLKRMFVDTSNSRKIFAVCRTAHLTGQICVITGEAGVGKTESLREYEERNKSSTIRFELHAAQNAVSLFTKLHKQLGLGDGTKQLSDLYENCQERLAGTGRLIICDQVEFLPVKAIELLRGLHDQAGVGLVLAGLPRLMNNIRGKRGQFAQIYTRVYSHIELKSITENDCRSILGAYIPEAVSLSKTFYQLSRNNLRTVVMLVNGAMQIAVNNKCEIDKAVVQAAASNLAI